MLFWKGLTGKMLSVQTYNKCTCNFEFNFSFVQKVGAKSMFWRQKIRLYAMYFIFMCSGPKSNKVVKDILKCNSSPDKHVFLYLFPDCLCIIIHFSAYPTTIRARVLCLLAQVCKRKNPISEPSLDLAVILVTSRYEDNTLPVNSEQ